jgi:hypothetical protein
MVTGCSWEYSPVTWTPPAKMLLQTLVWQLTLACAGNGLYTVSWRELPPLGESSVEATILKGLSQMGQFDVWGGGKVSNGPCQFHHTVMSAQAEP